MARDVVTGYCWPQSVGQGERVDLHLSSSGGRPVRVEVARVGARREVVFSSDVVAAGEQETPPDAASKGCGWPAALALDVEPTWRSGYYEVVMEIDVGEKVRRDYAFFVVRPRPGTRLVLALATNTWHAYNDFGGPNLYTGGTPVPARPIRRTPHTSATSRSTTSRATPGRPVGPIGSCRSCSGPNTRASRS